MKTGYSKLLLGRIFIELLIFLMVFVAVDEITVPSEGTRTAVLDAVNKKQLEPSAAVDVSGAIHSASFVGFVLWVFRIAALLLICSDLWLLWRSRRETGAASRTNGAS